MKIYIILYRFNSKFPKFHLTLTGWLKVIWHFVYAIRSIWKHFPSKFTFQEYFKIKILYRIISLFCIIARSIMYCYCITLNGSRLFSFDVSKRDECRTAGFCIHTHKKKKKLQFVELLCTQQWYLNEEGYILWKI